MRNLGVEEWLVCDVPRRLLIFNPLWYATTLQVLFLNYSNDLQVHHTGLFTHRLSAINEYPSPLMDNIWAVMFVWR